MDADPGHEGKIIECVPEPYSWRPAEPKPFYWLKEVATFLGLSKTNTLFKVRMGHLRAKMHREGSLYGWVVAHEEMVRYMEEGSWRLRNIPIVEVRAEPPREPDGGPAIPDPPPHRRARRGKAIPTNSCDAKRD